MKFEKGQQIVCVAGTDGLTEGRAYLIRSVRVDSRIVVIDDNELRVAYGIQHFLRPEAPAA